MIKIGLIGTGSIGQFLLQEINLNKRVPNVTITTIFDERPGLLEHLQYISNQYECEYMTDRVEFLLSDIDLFVECANPDVAKKYALDILDRGKNMLIVSVGALVDRELTKQMENLCYRNNCHVFLPTGAIGGLDALNAANMLGEIEHVQLTTRKPPDSLSMTTEISEPLVIFSGTAAEAIAKFPKNMNIAILLSFAGIGVEQTRVKIVADPKLKRNVHEVCIKGAFGKMKVRLENLSMPANPRTSYLAALSILSMLQRMFEPIHIG